MNAMVGIRANATGFMSPTQEERLSVAQRLAAQTAARRGQLSAAAKMDGNDSVSRVANQELSRDAFLELLVQQLQNQDPLDPVDNQDMLAQLAQFTSLEQMNNLNDSFATLSGNVDQLNFISASQMVGRTVTGVDLNGEVLEGVVEGVHLDGSVVVLSVDGGLMSMAGVQRIE